MQRPAIRRTTLSAALLCAIALSACQSMEDSQVDDSHPASDATVINQPAPSRQLMSPPPTPPAPASIRSDIHATPQLAMAQRPTAAAEAIAESEAGSLTSPAPVASRSVRDERKQSGAAAKSMASNVAPAPASPGYDASGYGNPGYYTQPANTEKYAAHDDNPVHRASEQPVSTFSIDVDTGSYTNVRRMINQGVRPPADAVRAEEMINYFSYGHPAPKSLDVPFRVTTELAPAPWNGKHQLLMVGIKGYDVPNASLPPANLVFLIDTSGSMNSPDKLPLLKQAFSALVKQLRPQDHVSIVVYAGSAGLVLPPTAGDRMGDILAALDRLQAGGSTNGGDGIRLAYAMARQGFVKGGVNRVLLATDGDFNVGTTDQGALETLVADQRKTGIALTTLGFGSGNYNDALAEKLADVGDGNHAYIDSAAEARKVLVQQMGGTLLTIAKDVKIQIEFNPAQVAEYRLIGYENRVLRREDFANDKVDAGDIGAGHEVTALYEITPVGSGAEQLPALRYGREATASVATGTRPGHGSVNRSASKPGELADLRLRYKRPGEANSRLIDAPILRSSLRARPSTALRLAAVVAAYADGLRGGTHLGQWTWRDIVSNARAAQVDTPSPQRTEFVKLAESAQVLVGGGEAQLGTLRTGSPGPGAQTTSPTDTGRVPD